MSQFFSLTLDNLKRLLNSTLTVFEMKNSANMVHARSTSYDAKGAAVQASTVNKVLEKLAQKKGVEQRQKQVSDEYLAKVKTALDNLQKAGGNG